MLDTIRVATAIAGGFLSFGVMWGFSRILLARTDKTPLTVFLCLTIVGAFALLVARALYVSLVGSLGPMLGILFNLLVCVIASFGLHAQLLMISPKERASGRWNWFNAWRYPPGGLSMRARTAADRLLRLWRGAPSDIDRRHRNEPDAPKRRKDDFEN